MNYPDDYRAFLQLSPLEVQTLVDELVERSFRVETMDQWLRDWSHMSVMFQESLARFDIAVSINTADQAAAERVTAFRETIWPIGHRMDAQLRTRLFEYETILPPGLASIVEQMKQKANLNQSEAAIALLNQENELMSEYGALLGAQTIEWQGQTLTNRQARGMLIHADPSVREGCWRLLMTRQQQDYKAIGSIWVKMLDLREALAHENGFANFLDYCWKDLERFDYTPDDSVVLHEAFLETWSPLYARLMEKKRQIFGLDSLPPWDAQAFMGKQPLQAFNTPEELLTKTSRLFHQLDPDFGANFDRLVDIGFIDIAMRANTMPVGGFARGVGKAGIFVMLNCDGSFVDVVNLTHEMGHAFAMTESTKLPYHLQWGFPQDFGETPSTIMEMLSMPYWDEFYEGDALTQVKQEYFDGQMRLTLSAVVIEAFQIWAYTHPDEARDVSRCDAKWLELTQRYLPNIDYTTQSDIIASGWQRTMTLFYMPIFSMEYVYGRIAGLNLLQIAEQDAVSAMLRYKQSIGSGSNTKTNFAALGTDFFFSADDVARAAKQLETYLI